MSPNSFRYSFNTFHNLIPHRETQKLFSVECPGDFEIQISPQFIIPITVSKNSLSVCDVFDDLVVSGMQACFLTHPFVWFQPSVGVLDGIPEPKEPGLS